MNDTEVPSNKEENRGAKQGYTACDLSSEAEYTRTF